MSKITYTDKVTLNENPNVADANKVKVDDLNEIKNVVNANDDNVGDLADLKTTDVSSVVNAINEINDKFNYTQEEQRIGTWIDGKPIYRKVYVVTSTNMITTGISWDTIVDAKMMSRQSNGQWRNIPWLFNSTDTSWMGGFYLLDSDHTIRFQLGSNLNSINYAHIILLYTKTTD